MKKKTPQIENGFIRIASGDTKNDLFSALIRASLNATEYQVVLFVIRKTWGWNKKEDWISLSSFEKITGKTKQSIINATSQLVKKNILVKKTIPGIKTSYLFNKDFSSWVVKETLPVKETLLVKKTLIGGKENFTGVVKKTLHTKDTITKDTIQKKYISIYKLNNTHFENIAKKYNVPISFVKSKYDDMINWHEATGKKKKDWVATLRNFVKKDAIERIDNAKKSNYKTAIDASNT